MKTKTSPSFEREVKRHLVQRAYYSVRDFVECSVTVVPIVRFNRRLSLVDTSRVPICLPVI
ncbi:hypothetical protein J6590_096281 [Homalodisca vitripennis]|nr:hypothetical protein J6590_096281 [Homalodisca vitripennis]